MLQDALLAPRLPRTTLDALETLADAARRLPALRRAVTGGLERMEQRLDALLDGIGALGTDLRGMRRDVKAFGSDITALRERVSAIEPRTARIVKTTDGIPKSLQDLEDIERDIEQRTQTLDARLSRLEKALVDVVDLGRQATKRLPDPDAPGPLARARDALTGRE